MTEGVELESRIKAYILNVEQVLENINIESLDEKQRRILELARSYLHDAKYYYENRDYITALSCIAYAEGLIDSLNHLGLIKIEWKPYTALLKRPRVVVAGSFEIIHPGHIYLLKKAWMLGEVIVIVSRDVNFARFKSRKPVIPEEQRRIVVENIKYVSKAILGDENDLLKPIIDLKPDIILLGPDQWITPDALARKLSERGLNNVKIVKLEERLNGELYSVTSIIEKIKSLTSQRE